MRQLALNPVILGTVYQIYRLEPDFQHPIQELDLLIFFYLLLLLHIFLRLPVEFYLVPYLRLLIFRRQRQSLALIYFLPYLNLFDHMHRLKK